MDKQRLKQFNDQAKAIEERGKTKVTRVGDRDDEYGFQEVIEPDGSLRRDGVKTYNAQIPSGTPVLATERSDGLTALSSLKADEIPRQSPLAAPRTYLKGRVFGYPTPRPIKGQRVHVLYSSQGKLWIGGHKEIPEEVGANTISNHKLWADNTGWIVTGTTNTRRVEITASAIVEGALFPTTIEFVNSEPYRYLGFGRHTYRGAMYANGQWYTSTNRSPATPTDQTGFSQNVPIAIFGSLVIRKFAGVTPYRNADGSYTADYTETNHYPARHDRTSSLTYYEKYTYTEVSGYTILTQSNGPSLTFDPFSFPDYDYNFPALPNGMYTDGIFTTVQYQTATTDINNLKSGPGLVSVTTQKIGEVLKSEQVQAFKIPADAFIIDYVSIAP